MVSCTCTVLCRSHVICSTSMHAWVIPSWKHIHHWRTALIHWSIEGVCHELSLFPFLAWMLTIKGKAQKFNCDWSTPFFFFSCFDDTWLGRLGILIFRLSYAENTRLNFEHVFKFTQLTKLLADFKPRVPAEPLLNTEQLNSLKKKKIQIKLKEREPLLSGWTIKPLFYSLQ